MSEELVSIAAVIDGLIRRREALREDPVYRWADEAQRWGAVGGHPETLAALVAHPAWMELGVPTVPMPWAERGQVYTGEWVAMMARMGDEIEAVEARRRRDDPNPDEV